MITIKSYTDIEQAKKLVDILPLESADMCYIQDLLANCKYGDYKPYIGDLIPSYGQGKIRCWSLSALLDVIPQVKLETVKIYNKKQWRCWAYYLSSWHDSDWYSNPIDACYETIVELNELKLL